MVRTLPSVLALLCLATSASGQSTIGGCAWAGIIGVAVGTSCDSPVDHAVYTSLKTIHDALSSGKLLTTAEVLAVKALGLPLETAYDTLSAVFASAELDEAFASSTASPTASSPTAASPTASPPSPTTLALTLTSSASIGGCAWAGLIGVSVGTACDDTKMDSAAYKSLKAIHDAVAGHTTPSSADIAAALELPLPLFTAYQTLLSIHEMLASSKQLLRGGALSSAVSSVVA